MCDCAACGDPDFIRARAQRRQAVCYWTIRDFVLHELNTAWVDIMRRRMVASEKAAMAAVTAADRAAAPAPVEQPSSDEKAPNGVLPPLRIRTTSTASASSASQSAPATDTDSAEPSPSRKKYVDGALSCLRELLASRR